MEINNHTDTTVLVSNFLPVHYFEKSVDVSIWESSDGSVECLTISGAIAYDHLISGQVFMLVYHQVINCPRLVNHLMCPIQSQMAGVRINGFQIFIRGYI